jgi:hypothetical protein
MIAELFEYLTKARENRAGFFILLSGAQSPNKSTTDSNTHTPKNRAKRSMGLIRSSAIRGAIYRRREGKL